MLGIVLSSVKYGDSSLVVNVLTRDDGRRAFIVPARRSSRHVNVAAMLMPLSQIEFEPLLRRKNAMPRLAEPHLAFPYTSIHSDNVKRQVCFFIAELLVKSIPDDVPDPLLFDFVAQSLQAFDVNLPAPYNFHIFFMLNLSDFLGFGPDRQRTACSVFDLQAGVWTSSLPFHQHLLSGRMADLWHAFASADPLALDQISLSRQERHDLIDALQDFYALHHPGFRQLQCPDFLASLSDNLYAPATL